MCLPFSRLNGNWMVTEMQLKSTFPVIIQSPFSHHSVTIQSTERWDFILWVFKHAKLLWHGASVYDTHTYCRALSSGAVTTCFYDLGLSHLGFEHPTFQLRGQRSNTLRHALEFIFHFHCDDTIILNISSIPVCR